jgi:hypothetical protein
MRAAIAIILAGALGAGVGCGKKDDKKGDDSAKKVEAPDTPPPDKAADAAPAAGSDEIPEVAGAKEVPTEEDFEEKAAAEVNAGNLEDEVKKIEKELVPPE